MGEKVINKIIYFDKETIQNILQEQDHGSVLRTTDIATSVKSESNIEASAKVNLSVPFWSRLGFLFSGKLSASYIAKRDKTTTITSTEISEFEKIKPRLKEEKYVVLADIENSSTFFRVAGGYLKIVKGGVEGVDIKEFKTVMDSYDGYDTYKISDKIYVRFNNTAFVSNYKRNDILTTMMTLYCIPVGEFPKERFDFLKEISKMETLISTAGQPQNLAEVYPPTVTLSKQSKEATNQVTNVDKIKLYDVVYASVSVEDKDER
jgi:hypothetical protein